MAVLHFIPVRSGAGEHHGRGRLSWPTVAVLLATLAATARLSWAAFTETGGPCHPSGNCPPVVDVKVLSQRNTPRILPFDEDSLPNALMGMLQVRDPDGEKDGTVMCTTDNQEIRLDGASGKAYMIYLAEKLDREKEPQVKLSIVCSDFGTPRMSTTVSITLDLIDANDNAPQFTNDDRANVKLPENVEVGHFVTRVSAVDLDEGKNAEIHYFIPTPKDVELIEQHKKLAVMDGEYDLDAMLPLPEDDAYLDVDDYPEVNDTADEVQVPFRIDHDTGDIYTTDVIDREMNHEFHVPVAAEDNGLQPHLTLTWLWVEITDENDNPPVLLTTTLHARENQEAKTLIGQLQAKDLDVGRNAEVVFSRLKGSDADESVGEGGEPPFIVKNNGRVLTTSYLDRETTDRYTLVVSLKDKGRPRLSSTSTVVIIVDDVNDHTPVLTSRCLGDDVDVSSDRLGAGDDLDDEQLAADTQPGETRTFMDDGDRVTPFFYRSEFVDSGTESSTDSSGFNSKRHQQQRRKSGEISVDWSSPEGKRAVYTVSATDNDSGENGRVYFSLSSLSSAGVDLLDAGENMHNNGYNTRNGGESGRDLFDINPTSGEIYLRRYLLASEPLTHLLNVTVRDGGSPSRSAFCLLNVTFDVNVTLLTPPPSVTDGSKSNSTDGATAQLGPKCALSSTSLFCAIAVLKYIISVAVEYELL
ncbi:hypothetical protein RRG08_039729 [Elysia crispata]|uniref:Cadherin domain-containing protein n=1 Tax=Elysia crispata TaxID=231223 RepID=A0AAE1CVS5_9GAST|nr:hypothetical protein RRG08_039729 [Elysia crispata]